MTRRRVLLLALLLAVATPGSAAETAVRPTADTQAAIGVDFRTGDTVPLGDLVFADENGDRVTLAEITDRPLVLTLVYFRCPGICSPLLQELCRVTELSKLVPGKDYRLVTISFDPSDNPRLAAVRRDNLLAKYTRRHDVETAAWRVLTGDETNIHRLTEAIGFRYTRDRNGVDFLHSAAVTFLAPSGLVTGYLTGMRFNPPEFELAVADAAAGNARNFMMRQEAICATEEPESRKAVLGLNRVILGISLVLIAGFVLALVRGPKREGEKP